MTLALLLGIFGIAAKGDMKHRLSHKAITVFSKAEGPICLEGTYERALTSRKQASKQATEDDGCRWCNKYSYVVLFRINPQIKIENTTKVASKTKVFVTIFLVPKIDSETITVSESFLERW